MAVDSAVSTDIVVVHMAHRMVHMEVHHMVALAMDTNNFLDTY